MGGAAFVGGASASLCSLLRSLVRSHRDAMSVIDNEFQ